MKNKSVLYGIVALLIALTGAGALGLITRSPADIPLQNVETQEENRDRSQLFKNGGLRTDTSKTSVDLNFVLSGTMQKDSIPALTNPSFTSIENASPSITDDVLGITVSNNGEVKFYPYNILVWHEIVNDSVGGEEVVVTFCPLCGSALVFDAFVDGEQLRFGVSGKLYESNLLMYDTKTETLWSQILGEAVVGDYLGKKLTLLPFELLTFEELTEKYPEAQVLSDQTGHVRNYTFYPYGDYETNSQTLFPVLVTDQRFPPKDIMYAGVYNGVHFAFPLAQLETAGTGAIQVQDETITASLDGENVTLTREDGSVMPGYYAMWFSWATHHKEEGIVWKP